MMGEPTNAPDLRSLPLWSVEGSMGASPARGTSDIDELVRRQAALPGTWRGALYGFGAGLAGVDPRQGLTDALRLQQGQQEMGMRGQAEQRAQQLFPAQLAAAQSTILKSALELADQIEGFDEASRARFMPILENLMKVAGTGTMQTPEGVEADVASALVPVATGKRSLRNLVEDFADWTLDMKNAYIRATSGDKTGQLAMKLHDQFEKQLDQRAQSDLIDVIPQLATRARQDNKKLTVEQATQGMSPRAKRVLLAMKADDQRQLGLEIKPAKVVWDDVGVADNIGTYMTVSPEKFAALPQEKKTALVDAATTKYMQREGGIRAAEVTAAEDVRRGQMLTPEERAKHIDIAAFRKDLSLVQPPPGTRRKDLETSGQYAFLRPEGKTEEKAAGLKQAKVLVDNIFMLADRVITAETPGKALVARGTLPTKAFFRMNPEAAAYQADRDAFTGNLSRELGAERGVLTNQDIDRIGRGLPAFSDTAVVRDLKKAVIYDVLGVARHNVIAQATGADTGPYKTQLRALLDRLDKIETGDLSQPPKILSVTPKAKR